MSFQLGLTFCRSYSETPLGWLWTACLATTTFLFRALEDAGVITTNPANMWILPVVGYLGLGLGFSFLTLAIGMSRVAYHHELDKKLTVM
jgi:hypothetical protein